MKDFFEVVLNRCSTRVFVPTEIPEEDINHILRCAMSAPTASNKQPWEYIVLKNRDKLETFGKGLPNARMASEASMAIIVCVNPNIAHEGSIEYAVIDASAASQNILLSIEALGLGSVWTALFPNKERMVLARSILDIPVDIIPFCLIPIGKKRLKIAGKDKFKFNKIHYEGW